MFLLAAIMGAPLALIAYAYAFGRTTRNITLITGNSRKLADFEAVFGKKLSSANAEVDEIQSTALEVAIQKGKVLCKKIGPCLCEDTSLGLPDNVYQLHKKDAVFPVLIKHLIDACKVGGGNLVNALNAISPDHLTYAYTSTVTICTGTTTITFQCVMTCILRNGGGKGDIDPYVVPVCYTITCYENEKPTVLVNNQAVENPNDKTIGEMPEYRAEVHPRYFALKAAKEWLSRNGYSIKN